MNGIYGIDRIIWITPLQGLKFAEEFIRRALPYAIDYGLSALKMTKKYHSKKAESLIINSVGQRPTKQKTHANTKPRRGAINSTSLTIIKIQNIAQSFEK